MSSLPHELILESLDEIVAELKVLLPKKEASYGNRFRFGTKQAAIRISEKADRMFYGDDSCESMDDTIRDIVGWAAIAKAMRKEQ